MVPSVDKLQKQIKYQKIIDVSWDKHLNGSKKFEFVEWCETEEERTHVDEEL